MKKHLLLFSVLVLLCTVTTGQNTYVPDDNFEQALIDLGYDSGALNDSVPTSNISSIVELNVNSKNIENLTGIEDFVSLTSLKCYSNELNTLDVSMLSEIGVLNCNANNLTTLDVNANTSLFNFDCSDNLLAQLDISKNTLLLTLRCNNNSLQTLDLESNSLISSLYCGFNQLSELEVSNLISLSSLNCENNQLTALDVLLNTKLSYFNFESNLVSNINISANTALTRFECQNNLISSLDVSKCINLEKLYCHGNSIISLDISTNPELNYLQCATNQLTEIDVSACSKLQKLFCWENSIVSLDVSKNPVINHLACNDNQLSELNLKNGNINGLTTIDARSNPNLTCIDVDDVETANAKTTADNWYKDATATYSEDCGNFVIPMTYVPDDNFEQALIDLGYDEGALNDSVPTNVIRSLTSLYIQNKNIDDLTGIEDFWALIYLQCNLNNISTVDLSSNSNLEILIFSYNQLTSLDISNCINLESLNCGANELTELNLKNGNNDGLISMIADGNPNLTCIEVDDVAIANTKTTSGDWQIDASANYSEDCGDFAIPMTYVPDDNFEQALIDLGYDSGALNDSVPTGNISSVLALYVYDKNIADLTGIEDFTALADLKCFNNKLTSIDISSNTNLFRLEIYENQLTELNVSNCANLEQLQCQKNSIASLNISGCINLWRLLVYENQLTELNVSGFIDLEQLQCQNNSIVSLNLSTNPKLSYLHCASNLLTELNLKNVNNDDLSYFEARYNPNLTCIDVDDVDIANTKTTADSWYKDATATYSEDCGNITVAKAIDQFSEQNIEVFPNPVSDILNFKTNGSPVDVKIYGITGRLVFQENNFTKNQLNLSHLQQGVYLMTIQDNNNIFSKKLIVSPR